MRISNKKVGSHGKSVWAVPLPVPQTIQIASRWFNELSRKPCHYFVVDYSIVIYSITNINIGEFIMKYLLKEIRIYENKNSRGVYNWMRASLFVEGNPWANPGQLPLLYSTTQEVCDIYKPYADIVPETVDGDYREYVVNVDKVKTAINAGTIQDILHIDHIAKCVVKLPQTYVRVYRRDTVIDGVTHPKGEWMTRDGKPMLVDTFDIRIAQYYDDEDGQWHLTEEPETVVQRTLERGYAPYTAPVATSSSATSEEPVETPKTEEQKQAEIDALKRQMQALGVNV